MIRASTVLLVGPDGLCRAGLMSLFKESPFRVVGEVSAIAMGNPGISTSPEFAVMEIPSKPLAARRAVESLKATYPDSLVVVLSEKVHMETLAACLSAGVSGFLTKDISAEALLESLQLVALGETVLPTGLAGLFLNDEAGWNPPGVEADKSVGLSNREIEIVQWLLRGESNKVIARHLTITEATIKVHVKSVLRKIKVGNRTQAAIWAHAHGFHPAS